jgi:biotin carboxyl carrier protein
MVLRPGQAETTAPPGGASATAIYSAIVTGAQPVDPDSAAGRVLTRRILADRALLEQVSADEPVGSEPPDWPLPNAPSWLTASTAPAQARPDPADPANTVVRVPSVPDIPDGALVEVQIGKVGDAVQAGQPMGELETAKVTADFPAPVTGVLLEITIPDDGMVHVGDPIAIVGPGPPAPVVTVAYEYALVSLTRRVAGTPWWDDLLLSDTTWFVTGRAAGGLLPAQAAGTANALPYALLVVQNVLISNPGQPPADVTNIGPVQVANSGASGGTAPSLGWAGLQAVGLIANVLPPLPPKDDPALPKAGLH